MSFFEFIDNMCCRNNIYDEVDREEEESDSDFIVEW